jgi:hypothetical protein
MKQMAPDLRELSLGDGHRSVTGPHEVHRLSHDQFVEVSRELCPTVRAGVLPASTRPLGECRPRARR